MLEHKTRQIQTAVIALSLAALGAGCHSSHPSYYTGGYGTSGSGSPTSAQYNHYHYQAASQPSTETRSANASQVSGQQNAGETVIPLYEEQVRVGTREVDAGSVRLRKVVTTETVNQPVQVRRETVVIDREPSGQGQAAAGSNQQQQQGSAFQEQETVIQLKREEPVVETQMVPAGRIVAQKKTQSQQQSIQRQIRREDVQVEKVGNPENVIISENLRNSRQREATGAGGGSSGQSQGSGTNSNNSSTGETP